MFVPYCTRLLVAMSVRQRTTMLLELARCRYGPRVITAPCAAAARNSAPQKDGIVTNRTQQRIPAQIGWCIKHTTHKRCHLRSSLFALVSRLLTFSLSRRLARRAGNFFSRTGIFRTKLDTVAHRGDMIWHPPRGVGARKVLVLSWFSIRLWRFGTY